MIDSNIIRVTFAQLLVRCLISHSVLCSVYGICFCFFCISSKNNVKRIRGLLNAGVPPSSADYDHRTALHLACSEGHLEAAQLLIEEGADANKKDRFGCTPLDDAQRSGHHELVAYLRSKKAKHGGLDKLQAKLIEHCAKNELSAAGLLLQKDINGADVPHSAGISPNCWSVHKAARHPLLI
jgi:ankyrin repeat protein